MPEPDELDVDVEPAVQPGMHSFASDMDVASRLVARDRCLMRAPLTPAVASRVGSASIGMIMTLVDVGASDPALATCRPDWTATQNLSVHSAAWLTEGPVIVDNRLVRVGKKVIIVAADVYDGHGTDSFDEVQHAIDGGPDEGPRPRLTLAARSLLSFARLPGDAARGMDAYDPGQWLGQIRHRTFERPPQGTLRERMGLRVLDADAGSLELALTPYVANSIGTINGGAQAVLVEAAAEAMRPDLVATDVEIHYLAQVRLGPAHTTGTVLRDAGDHSVIAIDVLDAGSDDRLLARATVTLQRPPG
jgi:acyl-coenzyme A thioesterase PaaI-like protein